MTERDDDDFLDRLLDAAPPVTPSAALRRAVAEIPLRHPRATHSTRFAWRVALVGALLATTAGVLFGSYGDALELESLEPIATEAAADERWDDLAELAFATDLDTELEP